MSLDPVDEDARGPRAADLAQPLDGHRLRAAVPHVPERLQEQPLDLHARIGRAAARRRGRARSPATGAGSTCSSMKTAAGEELRPSARFIQPDGNDPDDQTVLAGAALLPRAAPRRDRARHRLRSQAAAHLRPHRLRAGLLPGRPVVPEDRRLRAGRNAGAQGRGMELPRLPRQLRVLRGLRPLRRLHDGPVEASSSGQPASVSPRREPATRPPTGTCRTTSTTSPGRPIPAGSSRSSRSIRRATCPQAGARRPPASSA